MIIRSESDTITSGDLLDQFILEDEEYYELLEREELFWWEGVAKLLA